MNIDHRLFHSDVKYSSLVDMLSIDVIYIRLLIHLV